jgi:hypothetical protein
VPAPPPTPDTTPPAAPTALTAAAGETSVALDWADNAEGDLASYRVYRDGALLATRSSSSYTDAAVSAGIKYAYTVTAVDTSGNESAASTPASAIPTGDTTPPAAPTGLSAAPGNGQVTLNWTDNADADLTGYRVYRDGAPVASVTTSAYTDTGLTNGVAYRYLVTAIDDAANESAASAEVTATPVAPHLKTYQPSSHTITRGYLYAGSLASLAADDGSLFEVRSSKSQGWHYAYYYASATLAEPRSSLIDLTVDFRGRATSGSAWVDFYVYDWSSGSWEWLDGDYGFGAERAFTWTTTTPAQYVSSTGQVRFRVAGDHSSAFRTQTDLIRFSIRY